MVNCLAKGKDGGGVDTEGSLQREGGLDGKVREGKGICWANASILSGL